MNKLEEEKRLSRMSFMARKRIYWSDVSYGSMTRLFLAQKHYSSSFLGFGLTEKVLRVDRMPCCKNKGTKEIRILKCQSNYLI